MSTLSHLLFDHLQSTLIHGLNSPVSYATLFFTASDFTFTAGHIHNCVLFLLWLSLFIPSGVIFPLFSSSILGTYWPGKFIFQCPIFLPFHPVHGVLKERILKCLASSGWSIDLNYCDAECFTLEMNQDHSVIFEIAPKYCISDSYVDHEGYSISSKGFLPTIVDIVIIWIKCSHSCLF